MRLFAALSLLLLIIIASCKKEIGFITDKNSKLNFSEDTVLFDTVFTQVGSSTKQLKIYNPFNSLFININVESLQKKVTDQKNLVSRWGRFSI